MAEVAIFIIPLSMVAAASAYEQGDLVNADAWLMRAEALDGSNHLVLGLRQQLESASSQK